MSGEVGSTPAPAAPPPSSAAPARDFAAERATIFSEMAKPGAIQGPLAEKLHALSRDELASQHVENATLLKLGPEEPAAPAPVESTGPLPAREALGEDRQWNTELADSLESMAAHVGIPPGELRDWENIGARMLRAGTRPDFRETRAVLQQEWGPSSANTLDRVQRFVRQFPDTHEWLDATGLGDDPDFILWLDERTATLTEEHLAAARHAAARKRIGNENKVLFRLG
jgi:hypothetical protein